LLSDLFSPLFISSYFLVSQIISAGIVFSLLISSSVDIYSDRKFEVRRLIAAEERREDVSSDMMPRIAGRDV
jgi:hypothetical protein